MTSRQQAQFDATYFERYTRRNMIKTRAILQSVGRAQDVLDIGCNQGYVLRAFLEGGWVKRARGIELDASIVDPWLLADKRFSLLEGSVVDYPFTEVFEAIVFNSVFHHIVGNNGLGAAFKLWDQIVDHCDRILIFETGVLSEFGKYYWKDAHLRYYSTDEGLLRALLKRIGPRLKSCRPIAMLPIHLARRPMYAIDLHSVRSEFNLKDREIEFYGQHHKSGSRWTITRQSWRTGGSRRQQLIDTADQPLPDGSFFRETEFYELEAPDGSKYFSKRIMGDPYKRMREFQFLRAVVRDHVIPLVEVNSELGLLFPYYSGDKLGDLDLRKVSNRQGFAREIAAFFQWASQEKLTPGILDLDPQSRGVSRSLIEMIDLHPNNFLVNVEDGAVRGWVLLDLEYFSNTAAWRNYAHLYRILSKIESGNWLYLLQYGWWSALARLKSGVNIFNIVLRLLYSPLEHVYAIFRPARSR